MLILTHGNTINNSSVFSSVDSVVPMKPDLEEFWKLETLGISKPVNSYDSEDQRALERFKETLLFENGRYTVKWPWKEEVPDINENRGLAIGRLRSLVSRMQKQPGMMLKYDTIIQDQLEKGIIEKVDRFKADGMKHYIPHHVVITPQKSTTKLRIVYDASARSKFGNKSLNECLYRGPVLLQNLCGILLRFRLYKIGIVSDIEKAFLQVGLQKSERDVTRFVWLKDHDQPIVNEDTIQEFRFCRVPFGVISSPFLLGATVEAHLDSYSSEITDKIKNDIYMDNVITGANSVIEASNLYSQSKTIFNAASMNLREWMTSSVEVNMAIPPNDCADRKDMKVLGLAWNASKDTLAIQDSKHVKENLKVTKRNVLKEIASVYDPLGLLCPVILRGKVLLQNLWKKQLDWDDELDMADQTEWLDVKMDLDCIHQVEIKRCIRESGESKYHLVCFCDASTVAYASAVYLIQCSGTTTSGNLVFSKARLAPIKELTIPRLELMAVLIGVRSLQFVREQMRLPFETLVILTDSQCVLHWIKSEKTLPTFVKNRVEEINSHKDITFEYVNTKENPADIASRGCTVQQIADNELWWKGPDWLQSPFSEWPKPANGDYSVIKSSENETKGTMKNASDERESAHLATKQTEDESTDQIGCTPFGMDINRYSTLLRLKRVTAWCIRFVEKTRHMCENKDALKKKELEKAERLWIKHTQRNHFPDAFQSSRNRKSNHFINQLGVRVDDYVVLRCQGRMENAALTEGTRFPILLPSNDKLTELVIEDTHARILHSGVSQTLGTIRLKYWIIRGRASVKKVLRKCVVCKRLEGGPYKMPLMAPLPKARVSEATPFSRTGLDYLGPLHTRDNGVVRKIWICLFTCFVTRAIHLEIVSDMTTTAFLFCLRRFIATRGTPSEIVSDNAMQFKLADKTLHLIWKNIMTSEEIQSYFSGGGIKWSFIVELSPWMGGFYERLVGLVKRSLRKTVGRKLLSNDQMHTVVKEVESVVNARPLVYIGDDIDSTITITPSHFLCLNPKIGIPETVHGDDDPDYTPYESSERNVLQIWKKGERLINQFWKAWRNDYLLSLRERTQYKLKSGRIQSHQEPNVDDIVIVKDETPRGSWKLAKIVELNVSRDGLVRSAVVKLGSGRNLVRPLCLLYPLECSDNSSETLSTEQNDITNDTVEVRKSKRRAADIARGKIRKCLDEV